MTLMKRIARSTAVPLVIAIVSTAALYLYERWYRINAPVELMFEGYRFQAWPSNWMMQTLGLEEMVPFGPMALVYDHIYPPGLDAIRYLLTWPETHLGLPLDPIQVDFRLYMLYAVLFGLLNALIYVWVRDLTKSWAWATGAAVVWAIYPGHLMLAMLLEPSELSLFNVALMFFFLYKFLRTRKAYFVPLFLLFLLLASLSRSFIQIYVLLIIVVAVVCFWFMTRDRNRSWGWQILNVLLVAAIFAHPVKQFIMYDTWSTTSYGGYHRVGMIGLDPTTVPQPATYPQKIVDNALAFSSHYNTQEQIKDNYRLEAAANQYIKEHPVDAAKAMAHSLTITIPEMFRPTADYVQNNLVNGLPWTPFYDWVFSGWRYVVLIAAAIALIIRSRGWAGSRSLLRRYGWFAVFWVLIAIPVLWSNRFFPGREAEGPIWTDAIRQKIFLEMPVYVMLFYAAWVTVRRSRVTQRDEYRSAGSKKTE